MKGNRRITISERQLRYLIFLGPIVLIILFAIKIFDIISLFGTILFIPIALLGLVKLVLEKTRIAPKSHSDESLTVIEGKNIHILRIKSSDILLFSASLLISSILWMGVRGDALFIAGNSSKPEQPAVEETQEILKPEAPVPEATPKIEDSTPESEPSSGEDSKTTSEPEVSVPEPTPETESTIEESNPEPVPSPEPAAVEPTPETAQPPVPLQSSRGQARPAKSGSCECPYDTDSRGRRCGGRSAYSKAGGNSGAYCYVN